MIIVNFVIEVNLVIELVDDKLKEEEEENKVMSEIGFGMGD